MRMVPLALLLATTFLRADPPKPLSHEELQGTWLFDSAKPGKGPENVHAFWNAKVVVADKSMTIEKFVGTDDPLRATLDLHPAGAVGHIDLVLEEFDFKQPPLKFPAGRRAGVYRRSGDMLEFAFHVEAGKPRPKTVDDGDKDHMRFRLEKAPKGFIDFPKQYTLNVTTPDGQPAKGVSVGRRLHKPPAEDRKEAGRKWTVEDAKATGGDGTLKLPFVMESREPFVAWDGANNCIGIAVFTPTAFGHGRTTISLRPACNVTVRVESTDLAATGLRDDFGCTVGTPVGMPVVSAFGFLGPRQDDDTGPAGRAEFPLPPGEYSLRVRGSYLGKAQATLSVPEGKDEYEPPPVAVPVTPLVKLVGKPAPELPGVVAWAGKAAPLADLKGKVVLLDFWGWWCPPCVKAMPGLMELHEKYADKGLAVVGVHVDSRGEVDTVEKYEAKIASHVKDRWNGKALPFPVALVSIKRTDDEDGKVTAPKLYGVQAYPTTILIGRDGKVIGQFEPREKAELVHAAIEKLLGKDDKK